MISRQRTVPENLLDPEFSLKKQEEEVASSQLKKELDRISFRGHRNILSTHKNTIEITKDAEISKRADCIIGVLASKGCADLNPILRQWIRSGHRLEFEIKCGTSSFFVNGQGSSSLDLSNQNDLVLRRSDYASSRTVSIRCSSAACDLPRELIRTLQNPNARGELVIRSLPRMNDEEFVWHLP